MWCAKPGLSRSDCRHACAGRRPRGRIVIQLSKVSLLCSADWRAASHNASSSRPRVWLSEVFMSTRGSDFISNVPATIDTMQVRPELRWHQCGSVTGRSRRHAVHLRSPGRAEHLGPGPAGLFRLVDNVAPSAVALVPPTGSGVGVVFGGCGSSLWTWPRFDGAFFYSRATVKFTVRCVTASKR